MMREGGAGDYLSLNRGTIWKRHMTFREHEGDLGGDAGACFHGGSFIEPPHDASGTF